jgi:hypothetical protein
MNTAAKHAAPCIVRLYFARLGPKLADERLSAIFEALVRQQNEQFEQGEPVSPIPLAWVALAEWVGLTVDIPTGRIVDGPREAVRGLL